jgi:CRISPR system Cascade subunit CasB
MTDLTTSADAPTVPSLVSRIARLLDVGGALGSRDVAALRRMDPRAPDAAFFKIEGLVLDEHLPGGADARADMETRWAAVVSGLAHLGSLHRPGERLGRALAEAQWAEQRFVRLVRADADRLVDDLPALARFLAAKGVAVDWGGAAQLILSAGRRDDEQVRRHLARDYYGILARQQNA